MEKLLFKYRPFNGNSNTVRIFTSKSLYFGKYEIFNDPFDCSPDALIPDFGTAHSRKKFVASIYDDLESEDAKQFLERVNDRDQYIDFYFELLKEFLGDFRILSMSRKHDSLLMWSHYADNHKGLCLGFDTTRDTKLFSSDVTKSVSYQTWYPFRSPSHDFYETIETLLTTKALDWAYEEETRIIVKSDHQNLSQDSTIVFRPQSLREVYCGMRMSDSDIDHIRMLLSNDAFRHVKLFKAKRASVRYGLDFEKI